MRFRTYSIVFFGFALGCADAETGVELVQLTSEPGIYSTAVYSPDGTRLAYTHRQGNEERLKVATLDGGNVTTIGDPLPDIGLVVWSQDSRDLVFVKRGAGLAQILTTSASGGGGATRLSSWAAGNVVEVTPNFAPDGSRVLFLSNKEGIDLWTVPAEGGEPTRITTAPGNLELNARWSPDGSRIGMFLVESGRQVVAVIDVASGAVTELTSEGVEVFLEWSPDGAELLFQSNRTGFRDIWVVPVSGGEARQVTRDIRDDWAATYSRDGSWIAYQSERGGQDDIWIVPAAGGESIRVTNDAAEEFGLTWNPDGKGITFGHTENVSHLYSVSAAGGDPRQLTFEGDDNPPQISPDGRFLAFSAEGSGFNRILIMPVEGGESRALTGFYDAVIPRWSPDGATIAFNSRRGGKNAIWTIPFEGGDAVQISPEGFDAWDKAWSPDGTAVAFVTNAAGGLSKIMTVPAGGGNSTLVADLEFSGGPSWSPDGAFIAFTSSFATGGGKAAIYVVPSAGGGATALTPDQEASLPRWSADGSSIAYTGRAGEGENPDIFVMDSDGSNRRQLTFHEETDTDQWWSTDGSEIIFMTRRNGNWDLAAVPVEGGDVRLITDSPGDEYSPVFSNDGSTFYYAANTVGNVLVTVDVRKLIGR